MTIDQNILLSATSGQVHFALRIPFDELYTNLQKEVELKNIYKIVNPSGELELYSYSNECSFEDKWSPFSLISRGLVICPKDKKVVAITYPKFFNYGEKPVVPDEGFIILEKCDGSLGVVFFYNNSWNCITRGSFSSSQGVWGTNYLNKLNISALNKNVTYLTEIIYKENRIVIDYSYEGLVLHGAYYDKGIELTQEELDEVAKQVGFRRPKIYTYNSLEELLTIADTLSYDTEGFVVKFNNGYRIKIKGAEYCRIHRIISLCTPLVLWEALYNKDNIEEIKKQLPEEFRLDFDKIIKTLNKQIQEVVELFIEANNEFKNLSDKELGLLSQNKEKKYPIYVYNLIFSHRKNNFFTEFDKIGSKVRKKIFDVIRPVANRLENYIPSSSMNHFKQESS